MFYWRFPKTIILLTPLFVVLESGRSAGGEIRTVNGLSIYSSLKMTKIFGSYKFFAITEFKKMCFTLLVSGKSSERPLALNHLFLVFFCTNSSSISELIVLRVQIGDDSYLFAFIS